MSVQLIVALLALRAAAVPFPQLSGHGGVSSGTGSLPSIGGGSSLPGLGSLPGANSPGAGGSSSASSPLASLVGSLGSSSGSSALGGALPSASGVGSAAPSGAAPSGAAPGGTGGSSSNPLGGIFSGLGGSNDSTGGADGGLASGIGLGGTANGVTQGSCLPVTVIFARGTGEGGNIGSMVGPSLQSDLNNVLPNKVAFQGVNYAADVAGDVQLGGPGGQAAAQLVTQAKQKCPNSKIFLSGYSEGGLVSHAAVSNLGNNAQSQVAGVLTYGDPFQTQSVGSIPFKTFCAQGDGVCEGGGFAITPAHLAYQGADTQQGAQWIAQIANVGQ